MLYESKYHNVYLAKDAEQYLNDTFAKIGSHGENSPEAYEVYQSIDYSLITKEDLTVMDTVSSFLEECIMKRDFLNDVAKKKTDYAKLTKYDNVKNTKRENFRFLNETEALSGQTVLFGDSITEIFNWYELFFEYSNDNKTAVYNRGISGDTSDRLLERLPDNVLNIAPRNIAILIGTNDIGHGIPNDRTADNIEKTIIKIKESCPEADIILEAVYPVNKTIPESRFMVGRRNNKTIGELNIMIKEIAEKHGCVWLDLTDKLSDKKGELDKAYCYDGLHLNAHGFKIVAKNLIPLLK